MPGRALATWEDEVTARYDVQALRRDALLPARVAQLGRIEFSGGPVSTGNSRQALSGAEPESGRSGRALPSAREVALEGPVSSVTAIDLVDVTYEPTGEMVSTAGAEPALRTAPVVGGPPRQLSSKTQAFVPLYVLKALLTCYTDFMGAAARTVLKQEMVKLGLTPQNVERQLLPTLVGRLAQRLDTRAASDAFLRAIRLVDPALCTF